MTVDPRLGVYLNIIAAVLMSLTGATAMFTDLLGAKNTSIAMAIIGILLLVVNAVLHAIPSNNSTTPPKAFYLGPKQ